MNLTETRDLFLLWSSLRRGSRPPHVLDIDMGPNGGLPANAFVLDLDRKKEISFRLPSGGLEALVGSDLKDRSFIGLWRPKEAHTIAALLLDVVDAGCPISAEVAAAPLGELPATVEFLLLPLGHEGGAPPRILGLAACAKAPTWVGQRTVRYLSLRRLRIIREGDDLQDGAEHAARRSFCQKTEAAIHTFEQRGHLRVFAGSRPAGPLKRIRA